MKGASEIILDSCSKFVNINGNIEDLKSSNISLIENAIANMANDALRTIIIAKKKIN